MTKRSLGSLADLAKILEEASNPASSVREDRKENKPKLTATRKSSQTVQRVIDPKRKAWHDRRLKERNEKPAVSNASTPAVEPILNPGHTKAVASKLSGTLMDTLAAAKDARKPENKNKKVEAWKRKPGDPIF